MTKDETVEDLTQVICASIDVFRVSQCHNLTVGQILASLERIRHGLTENLIKRQKVRS